MWTLPARYEDLFESPACGSAALLPGTVFSVVETSPGLSPACLQCLVAHSRCSLNPGRGCRVAVRRAGGEDGATHPHCRPARKKVVPGLQEAFHKQVFKNGAPATQECFLELGSWMGLEVKHFTFFFLCFSFLDYPFFSLPRERALVFFLPNQQSVYFGAKHSLACRLSLH